MTKSSIDLGTTEQDDAGVAPLLEMRGIVKQFGRVKVLHGVDLTLYPGEVHALLGENGAGKSTLMKILSGDYIPDGGTVSIGGREIKVRSPKEAEAAGIRIIHQELAYAPELSVAENVLLGHLPRKPAPFGFVVDWPAAYRRSAEILATLKADIDPHEKMGNLGVGKKQLVEIAKALSSKVRVLVMDEPTAALTSREVRLLFDTIALLKERGVAIVYISHRLDEVEEIAQRLTVLRDGNLAGVISTGKISRTDIVRLMVGRPMDEMYPQREGEPGQTVLEVRDLSKTRAFEKVNFSIKQGEIVGLYGLLGAGQAEVAKALFGSPAAESGQIFVMGRPARVHSPRDAKRSGIGLVPDDRKVDGLVLGMSVADNMMLGNWDKVTQGGVFSPGKETARVDHWTKRLGIRMASPAQPISTLSGGNQQKAVLARWLEAGTKVLLLSEPTRGIDVGARADIYNVIEELRRQGLCLALISTDMEEVLALSDRIVVFAQGRVVGTFTREEASQDVLLAAAAGTDSRE